MPDPTVGQSGATPEGPQTKSDYYESVRQAMVAADRKRKAEPSGFWAQAHVNGERVVTETGETILSALALVQYVVNELSASGDIADGQIEILVRRNP